MQYHILGDNRTKANYGKLGRIFGSYLFRVVLEGEVPKTVKDAKLDNPTARKALAVGKRPHWKTPFPKGSI